MQKGEARGEGSLELSLGPRPRVSWFWRKVFCDYLAAAGSHTQKAGLTMASHLSPSAIPSIVHHSASIQALGLWCQAHVTVFMLCNELLNAFPTSRDPFDGGHVAIR